MEIKRNAIVIKLDSEEKEILDNAIRIIADIEQNQLIRESCSHDCPFKRYCHLANGDEPHDCILDTAIFNLKEILNNV